MRLRIPLATLSVAFEIAFATTSAQAQVPDPCTLYLCMASISGEGTVPANCTSAVTYWHVPAPVGLAIYSYHPWKFLAQPSYNYRKQYMNSCSGTTDTQNNSNISDTIMNKWGRIP